MLTHIKHVTDDNLSWCGDSLAHGEFHFKTIDQAIFNGMHANTTLTCNKCIIEISTTLFRGCFYKNAGDNKND